MPSPFPGMDPFIEGQEWEDFHHALIEELRIALMAQVVPRYVVRVEKRVYLERQVEEPPDFRRGDVLILQRKAPSAIAAPPTPVRGAALAEPVVLTLPMPEEHEEAFLTIRWRETMEVVAVIELLSPTNKRAGSDGQREYLAKREELLRSATHLVELDLLCGGVRPRTLEPLPPGDYYALVTRGERRPRVFVYPWSLREPLRAIPIPLRGNDPDVVIDLQTTFTSVYDRTRYDLSLDYDASLRPPLSEADAEWVREQLVAAGVKAGSCGEDETQSSGVAVTG
jgi:hypothetical protein